MNRPLQAIKGIGLELAEKSAKVMRFWLIIFNVTLGIVQIWGEWGTLNHFFFYPLSSQNGTELFFVWQMTAVEKGELLALYNLNSISHLR